MRVKGEEALWIRRCSAGDIWQDLRTAAFGDSGSFGGRGNAR